MHLTTAELVATLDKQDAIREQISAQEAERVLGRFFLIERAKMAEERAQEESEMRILAEEQAREESEMRILAEERAREESEMRILAEERARKAEERLAQQDSQ
jgi:hypothetical protein